jgi:hypothetical protein
MSVSQYIHIVLLGVFAGGRGARGKNDGRIDHKEGRTGLDVPNERGCEL